MADYFTCRLAPPRCPEPPQHDLHDAARMLFGGWANSRNDTDGPFVIESQINRLVTMQDGFPAKDSRANRCQLLWTIFRLWEDGILEAGFRGPLVGLPSFSIELKGDPVRIVNGNWVGDHDECARVHPEPLPIEQHGIAVRVTPAGWERWRNGAILDEQVRPCYVTITQAAKLAFTPKKTLDGWKERGELPLPARKGRGRTPDLWDWNELRPALEKKTGLALSRCPTQEEMGD